MDNSSLDAGAIISHYRIVDKLGAGGMGEVYLAQDMKLDRKVALKILPRQFTQDESRLHRFIQEAKSASTLNHPNIITIHEIGEEGGTQFIATEFIQGETLRQPIARHRLSVREALDVATQIASALVEAHAAGIVHRDIKPENIMLRPNGLVKVLDFGLAKLTEQRSYPADTQAPTIAKVNTDPGTVMGTPTYMSPEQVRGLGVDVRSDIFSLGVVIYEMLAGRAPFEGGTTSDIISSILKTDPPPLARYSREVSPELQWVVSKALRKDCDERYQTARELQGDLKNLKRELDAQMGLDGSLPPESSKSPETETSTAQAAQTAGELIESTADVGARTTAGAEYFMGSIKRRRITALIGLPVLAAAIVGLFAYFHARNSEVAIESIAVLPFDNQNHDPDTEYLSDGLTESIINSLTQLPSLRVIARSSVFRYKGRDADPMAAGHELGVRAVLTGRILQRGDNLSVSAELVDIRDNKQLWGEQYERKVSGLLAMQREIAKEISNNLRLTLSGADESRVTKRYTENPEAYRLYLKGRFYWNKRTEEGVTKGIEYFTQSIERDARYALAYTGLADCYSSLGFSFDVGSLSPGEAIPKAKAAAMKALELDDTLAEAHTSLAFIRLNYDWDWSGAEREFKRAIELNPNYDNAHHWYSHYLMAMGRTEESLTESNRAMELDQLGLIINVHLGWHYLFAHQYELAAEQFKKTLELDPNFGLAYWYLGQAYVQKGVYHEAETELRRAKDLLKENVIVIAELGRAYAVSGNRAEANRVLDELKELSKRSYVSGYHIALIHAALGEKDRAFEWLEAAYKERSDLLSYLKVDPRVDNLRSDPRFGDFLRRIGLRP
jgi:eukaryotic-like serine/threonine-protein kinase